METINVELDKENEKRVIVFVDMTGSSAAWATDSEQMKYMVQLFINILLNLAKKFNCILGECNFTGDGMMLTFEEKNVIDAVNFGWLVPHLWWQMGGHLFRLRSGIFAGDVNFFKVKSDYNSNRNQNKDKNSGLRNTLPFEYLLCGDAINRAARLEAESKKMGMPDRYVDRNCFIGEPVKELLIKKINKNGNIDVSQFLSEPIPFEFEKGKLPLPDWSNIYFVNMPIAPKDSGYENKDILRFISQAFKYYNCGCEFFIEKAIKILTKNNEKIDRFLDINKFIKNNKGLILKGSEILYSIYKRDLGTLLSMRHEKDGISKLKEVKDILEAIGLKGPLHLTRLADAYFRDGKFKEALEYYKQSHERCPPGHVEKPEVEVGIIKCECEIEKENII